MRVSFEALCVLKLKMSVLPTSIWHSQLRLDLGIVWSERQSK
jgi:hypothetical protein